MKKHTFTDLINIMEKLRGPDGCPWDQKQDHESILKCLIEESYEFLHAVYSADIDNMTEELGDILLQVIFHSQIAKDNKKFSIDDVIQVLCEKLIRRHPHVFGSESVSSASGVVELWNKIKADEKPEEVKSILGNLLSEFPPLVKAEKIQKKVKSVGFEWPDYSGALEKIKEEISELEIELKPENPQSASQKKIEEELGDVLFSVVNLARYLNIDPSGALEKSNLKFIKRFSEVENLIEKNGKKISEMSLEEMEEYWIQAKTGALGRKA